jgi:hypothetical protein
LPANVIFVHFSRQIAVQSPIFTRVMGSPRTTSEFESQIQAVAAALRHACDLASRVVVIVVVVSTSTRFMPAVAVS